MEEYSIKTEMSWNKQSNKKRQQKRNNSNEAPFSLNMIHRHKQIHTNTQAMAKYINGNNSNNKKLNYWMAIALDFGLWKCVRRNTKLWSSNNKNAMRMHKILNIAHTHTSRASEREIDNERYMAQKK